MKKAIMNYFVWVVFLSLGFAVGVANADIEEGLVGHWTFDEGEGTTAQDSSGNDNHGTLVGGLEWVDGVILGALEFNGTDSIVDIPYSADITPSEGATISAWVFPTDTTRSCVVGQFEGYGMALTDGLQLKSVIWGGDWILSDVTIPTGEWSHIVMTWDVTNGDRMVFLNGDLVGQQGGSPAVPQVQNNLGIGLWVGRPPEWGDDVFMGIIDDVRLYGRVLSPEEIVEVYEWVGGANAGKDQRVEAGETVTLSGSGPADATSFAWEQIIMGDEPSVTLSDPDSEVCTFVGPVRTIGYILTFRLTVESPSTGTTSDECLVSITAPNSPVLAPGNFRIYPKDLGYRLEWDMLIDADDYGVGFKLAPGMYFWFWTPNTYYDLLNLTEGQATVVVVRGRNKYDAAGGAISDEITLVPMRNYALPDTLGGIIPPSDYVYVISRFAIAGMNDTVTEDGSNDSYDGLYKAEDYWGYLWTDPIYFDHVTYHTGDVLSEGGWFTSLKVQYTKDGTTWIDVPTGITPPYDFTDDRTGRQTYERYDMSIPTLRGTGIRIYGTPGGTATSTAIAELEVFADMVTARDLIVQGVDADVLERSTATLDGSFTFSTRGDITSGIWEQLSGPAVTIDLTADPLIATFEAPAVDEDTVLVFKLTAGDGTETLSDEDVRITVKNLVTTAVAGPDQSIVDGSEATADGSGSLTTTGNITYQWTQTDGIPVTLNNTNAAVCSFDAPTIWDYTEDVTLQLEVNDGAGGVSTDEVKVHVLNSALLLGLGQPLGTSWVQDVLVLGENYDSRINSTATNEDQLAVVGGEANVTPLPGDAVDLTGTGYDSSETPLVWTPMHRDDGWWFDSESGRGCVQENFIGYFHLYVISMAEQEARLHYGNDDDMRGWNNGELILSVGCCTRDLASDTFTLSAGINSMTFKVTEYGGGNYMGVRFTDRYNTPLTGLYYSLSVPVTLANAYAVRELPTSYEPGGTVEVGLSMRVNDDSKPSSVTISEPIPAGFTVVDDGGGSVVGSSINWSFSGGDVGTQVISYTLGVPGDFTGAVSFTGTISFAGTTDALKGDNIIYENPVAPANVGVDMLLGAELSWSANTQEGIIGYRLFRSVNGQAWEELGFVSGTSYLDMAIEEGSTYNYKVRAVNAVGAEGPFSDPTGEKMIVMEIREAEDYDYGGGQYPGYENCPAAVEATAVDDLAVGNDFWYATDIPAGDARLDYRPNDNCGTELREATVNIGWITVGDWWRYTVDVPAPGPGDPPDGWVKIVVKAAYTGTVDLFWDEVPVGSLSFATGDWGVFTHVAMEDYFKTTPGKHTLRVALSSGGMNFDTIGIGFNWSPPTRENIFEDDFEDYTNLYSYADLVAAGYTVENASNEDGAWRLWNTAGDMLGNVDPAIASMTDNYMISDSDLAGAVDADEELITPEIDCTNHTKVRLNFNKNYRAYADDVDHDQVAEVDVREVGGDWVNLLRFDTTTVDLNLDPADDTAAEVVDLSLYDGKVIQIRFHFYEANYDYWFAIDDVVVSGDKKPEEPEEYEIQDMGYAAGTAQLDWDAFGDGNYTVEYTNDLATPNWQPVPGETWPITATSWSGDIAAIFGEGVYLRVRSE